jgi:radical SAM superfamily enzyme
VVNNTPLCDMYNKGLYTPITMDYYIDKVIYILTHLDPKVVIHRIVADSPKNILVAPNWNQNKKVVMNKIDSIIKNENITQGMHLSKNI